MAGKIGTDQGFLTPRQIQIVRMRKAGLKQSEIASRLGTTRQNIAILERRALEKIEQAAITLQMLEAEGAVCIADIQSGTHILDAVRVLIEKADADGIRLKGNMVDLVSWFKSNMEENIISGRVNAGAKVMILADGRCIKLPVR